MLIWGMGYLVFLVFILGSVQVMAKECVVLIHGLARTSTSFNLMANRLKKAGYETKDLDYPSTSYEIEYLAENYIPEAINMCSGYEKIHFVTHSMGGILLRYYFSNHELPQNLGRVVMLAPPNKGSEVVDHLKDSVIGYNWWNGPAGRQLGTDEMSVPNQLGPVDYPVGVIAGTRESFFLSRYFDEPNDGKVSVSRTKVDGMKDHIVLHVTHTFTMNNRTVQKQVESFLKTERFQ